MIVLGLDTCFAACSVALARFDGADGDGVLLTHRFELPGTGHAERLAPMIREAVTEAGIAFGEITRLAVTVGPGSFTGVRVAVAAARALALATGAEVAAVDSLVVMRETAIRRLSEAASTASSRAAGPIVPQGGCAPLVVAVDARRGQLYCLDQVATGLRALARLSTVDDVAAALPDRVLIVGSGGRILMQSSRIDMPGWSTALSDLMPDARDLVRLTPLLPIQAAGTLAPHYSRPPDAKPQTGAVLARRP